MLACEESLEHLAIYEHVKVRTFSDVAKLRACSRVNGEKTDCLLLYPQA